MDSKVVHAQKKNILEKLSARHLKDAFDLLLAMSVNVQDWQISNRLADIETNYKFMLHYQFEGVVDPDRDLIYKGILRSLYELTDDISDELLTPLSPNILHERRRLNAIRTPLSLIEIIQLLNEVSDTSSLVSLLDEGDIKKNQLRELAVKRERADLELFNLIFIATRADEKTENEYTQFMLDASIPTREKCIFISALTMSLIHSFDGRKLSILMNACLQSDTLIKQRAIVGLVIILQMYDVRFHLYPECQYLLDTLSENNAFKKSVLAIVKQLIRSRETEEISRKMTEEIIPEMMKFSSLAGRKMNMQDLMGETDFADKNPEWKKELEDSGLANKLQEYSNLQMEGADVFHSTFANLKNFSFFREMANWFLPFDITYSELQPLTSGIDGLNSLLKTAVLNSSHMCDSDKYSFAFSLLQIPQSQRTLMMSRFGEESLQIKELQKDATALNPKLNEEIISNQYIQDLYRFFKLYALKNNFFDIFKLRLNFYDKKSIAPLVSDKQSMLQIANYCFDKNFFGEASSIYNKILETSALESDIWQKSGYCLQMLNDLQGALDTYLQAELLAPQNSWIIKRIAQVYRLLKDPKHSLQYYQHAAQLNPNNLAIELNIGHCYLELEEYDKALNCYFKVEVLETNPTKAWRAIAWTAFLLRRFDVSKNYYQKIIVDKPNVHDFLNAGHVEFCMDNKKEALVFYLKAVHKSVDFDQFTKLFEEDSKELIAAGIDPSVFPLLFDELRYKLD
ncbi:MAG: hypothetical protein RL662_1497 [Bacteroidota bacterium]|jgi:tetratricopeptide (TPR) repeat protein